MFPSSTRGVFTQVYKPSINLGAIAFAIKYIKIKKVYIKTNIGKNSVVISPHTKRKGNTKTVIRPATIPSLKMLRIRFFMANIDLLFVPRNS